MRPTPWLLSTAALALLLAPPTRGDDAKDALKKLTGTWTASRIVNDGQEGDAEALKGVQLVINDDGRYILRDPKGDAEGTITVDPAKSPAEMDATYEMGGNSGTAECIYKIDGDQLTVCWSGEARPDAFEAEAGSGRRLMTFKRAKD